jgi:hypothetical protein
MAFSECKRAPLRAVTGKSEVIGVARIVSGLPTIRPLSRIGKRFGVREEQSVQSMALKEPNFRMALIRGTMAPALSVTVPVSALASPTHLR